MNKIIDISVNPNLAKDISLCNPIIAQKLEITVDQITFVRLIRKSVDARKRDIKVNLRFEVFYDNEFPQTKSKILNYPDVTNSSEIIIIGAGPAGLFAALKLIELGYKPIVLERGKSVSERKLDIAQLNREHIVNTDSNYCFGEGGAGTFSDGKLYTRAVKRGNVQQILEILYLHGANENILYESHPHIGSDKLPSIITKIRETIESCGGKILFNQRVIDFNIKNNQIESIITQSGDEIDTQVVILATGHSARDIYHLLYTKGIKLEQKGFAMGLRVEHPQELIDHIQYHGQTGENLPAASYTLTTQVDGRGVYSFCMCPGGFIVPSATSQDEVVVNGMSPSKRNSPFANSGIVVEIRPDDLVEYSNYQELAGLKFQSYIEQLANLNGGYKQMAPAQRLADFVKGKISGSMPETSYVPGIASSPIHFWLPEFLGNRIREGFRNFEKKMHGFITNEAIVVGVESRTSSPVRIPRLDDTLNHPQIGNLFPCGEGAGYSGGIVSSALDGENIAVAIANILKEKKV